MRRRKMDEGCFNVGCLTYNRVERQDQRALGGQDEPGRGNLERVSSCRTTERGAGEGKSKGTFSVSGLEAGGMNQPVAGWGGGARFGLLVV
jgi:hypothetical protein